VSSSDPGQQFSLLEHVPVAMYVFEATGEDFVLRHVNACARSLSPTIGGFVGRPMAGLYSDQPETGEAARRALAQDAPVSLDMLLRRHDQTEATHSLRLTFVPLRPRHLLIVSQPTPNPPQAEVALRESEARYRGLLASLPDAVILRGAPDGRVLACNDIAAQLLGRSHYQELAGQDRVLIDGVRVKDELGRVLTEDELPSRRTMRTGLPESGRIFELEVHGKTRWVRAAAQPIWSSTGAVSASVTLLTDVTERVRSEQALRAAATRLDLALGAARLGVWEYDPHKDSGWWSENLHGIFAIPELPSTSLKAFVERVHADDRAMFLAKSREHACARDDRPFELAFRLEGDDGVLRWARVQGRLLHDPTRLVGTVMDVTEQHRMEEELRRAHRLESIGRLAGGVAHDFNNLLSAMMGALELIEPRCPQELHEDVATLRHGVTRARDLTRQLLAFARKQRVEFQVVDLSELVATVERLLRRLVGPSVTMLLTAREQVLVRADPASLEQVLVNLVVNARDAMPNGGELEVRVDTARALLGGELRECAVIVVRDSGAGMDEVTRSRLFDPFFTTKELGTGLGLASSYGIVQQHDGEIEVDSAPGKGTRFRVLLPLLAGATKPVKAPSKAREPECRKSRIMVVDDDDAVRNTTVRLLGTLSYPVLSAGSGAEALELARQHAGEIDVLLCDVAMPGRDGPALAAELLAESPGLKVVFISGFAEDPSQIPLEHAAFLGKPFTRAELVAKLEEVTATDRTPTRPGRAR